jgi:hypothetical protein
MQYLMTVSIDEKRWAELVENQEIGPAISRDLWRWYEELAKNGRIRGAGRLRPSSTATTVRESKGRFLITDGPFAETKEVLGGFHLLECNTQEEAAEVAKSFPGLRVDGTTVEVRRVMTDLEETQRWR